MRIHNNRSYLMTYLKNFYGLKVQRKYVIFMVDDYGNVRVDSKKARERMDKEGLKCYDRFDIYDTMETREDLEILYEALSSVKDSNGRNAVFSPLAVPCNINFEQIAEEGYEQYRYEFLPETFMKLASLQPKAFTGAWDLWKEGINNGLMVPRFHGREHLNIKVFNEKLKIKDKEILTVLKNRSYTSISSTGYKTIGYTGAFHFWDPKENQAFKKIIKTGLDAFEKVFGYRATTFNAPAGNESSTIYPYLKKGGIQIIEVPFIKKEHLGFGKYRMKLYYTGNKDNNKLLFSIRNVIFEPTANYSIDWVSYALKQIEIAFRLKKPAIISSHRVNFCGHIDPKNRQKGINALKMLLKKIVSKWPEVEFTSMDKIFGINGVD